MEFSIKQRKQDPAKGQFYLAKGQEAVAHCNYRMENDNTLVIEHTEIIPSARGSGVGKELVDDILRFAESENLKLRSECDYFSHQWDKMKK